MVSQADREIINSFVTELRPYLETVEVGVQEFSQPNRDGVIVGQAVQALMMIRGAGQILMVEGLVSISSWLVESFEKIQNNPEIAPTDATRRLQGLYSAMDDYLVALDRGDNVDAIVLRAKTIFEAIPSFGGPLPGTGKLRPRTDLDALFGEDEHSAKTRRITERDIDTERLAASAASAGPADQTAEMPEARPTVPLQSSEDVTQPVSDAATRRTHDAPARIVPIPPQPTEEIPRVDPELREIFEEEALEIIAAFGDGIRELARNPGDREAIRTLNRAAHTLKGAANMTGFPLIAQIGAAIELLFDEQLDRGQPVGRDVLELVAVSWKMLRAMVPNLNNLSSFTSPSNSIVQRANVLREQLAQAHAEAETIAMDERHYGPRAEVEEPAASTDQLVDLGVRATEPQETLPEIDASFVEAAPTVPLRPAPVFAEPAIVEPEPVDTVEAEAPVADAFVEAEAPVADAFVEAEAPVADAFVDAAPAKMEPAAEAAYEIVDEPATDAPFWSAVEAAAEPAEAVEDKPQSEPFWTPGTEELMRSSVGTDMLLADIQGLDDLEAELREEPPATDADTFFTSVDGDESVELESTPLDDGSWIEEPEPPQTDLLNFDRTPQTEPFWNTLDPPQSEPLEQPEPEEPVTMDPFFEPVDPDTSFLHSSTRAPAPEAEAAEEVELVYTELPVTEADRLVVEAGVPAEAEDVEIDTTEAVDDAFEAPAEQDIAAELEPFEPDQMDGFGELPELSEFSFDGVTDEATDDVYRYDLAFDFEVEAAEQPAAEEDVLVAEPTEDVAAEDGVESDTAEDVTPEQVETDFVEDVEVVAETAEQPEAEDIFIPAFSGAVAAVMAGAAMDPAPYIPEPFAIAAGPLVIDESPSIEPAAGVDASVWIEAEALVPTHHFVAASDEAAIGFTALLIETEAPAAIGEAPAETFEVAEIAEEELPEEEFWTAAPEAEAEVAEDTILEPVEELEEAEATDEILLDIADAEEATVAEDFIIESTEAVDGVAAVEVDAEVVDVEDAPVDEAPADTEISEDIVIETVEAVEDVEEIEADSIEELVPDGTEELLEETPAEAAGVEDAVVEATEEPEPEDVVLDDAEEAAAEVVADEIFADLAAAATDEVEAAQAAELAEGAEDIVFEPGDSALSDFDDVVASMDEDDDLGDLDWFDEPADVIETGEAPPIPTEDVEESPTGTGYLAEPGTGSLGKQATDTLGFGSLDLDRFLTTEGSMALSSALLDMAFTALPEAGQDDGLGAESISVFDESSERALAIEMFETFALEAEDHIAALNRAAMQLDRDPLASEPLIDIKRALHTLKGAAAAADFMAISDQTHDLEDALATQERLGSLSDRTFTTELFAATEEIEAKLARRKDELFGVSEEEAQAGGTLRVDVGKVDDLLNTVGELVVNRSSFEERLERLEATLEDLSTAAARLQRSSYLLEREASSEDAIGRLLRGELSGRDVGLTISDVQSGWDMLEMDRYTEFDRLIRQLAEVGADVTTAVGEINALHGDFDTISNRQRRLTTALQDELMGIRMVPISSLAPRLYRVVRRAASRRGKEVSLIIEGGETPFDKILLDTLSESLLHLLRNSVDHGIEELNERRRLGKPEQGSIRIRAFRDGSEAVIEIIDDGAGIDHQAVIQHARERGMSVPDDISREEALLLIFEPGFTTKDEADDISGRGLGLEIVEQTVSRYKGRVAVDSVAGRGTVFSLRLPVMLSVIQAFLVSAGEGTFAIPVANVDYVVDRVDQPLTQIGNSVVIETANQIIPVVDVSARIGRSQTPVIEKESGWVMVTELAGKRWALVVDELHGQQEIVVKPLGRFLRATPGLMGATILGHGDVALIVDVPALLGVDSLVTRLNSVALAEEAMQSGGAQVTEAPAEERPAHVVLVVDDSLSVRRVVSRTIERHGWVAVLARDGVEALELLEQGQADIVLTDIEMPRMDGFELISAIRSHTSADELPIVVLTSRSGEKHRERALGLGANEYLVKPFQEQELVDVVENMSRASSEV